MNKKIKYIIIEIIILIAYLLIGAKYHIHLRCPIYEITGFYCPGCGLTRMLISILKLDFYQAFRYNPLVFIYTPFAIILFIEKIYSESKKRKSIIKKIPNYIWFIIITITLVFGIIRNIIPYLEPTVI